MSVTVTHFETMRADAGWRRFSFLKLGTSDGVVGWSEYNEDFGSAGLSAVIEALAPHVVGSDPRRWEAIVARLHVMTRQSRGGLVQQAIAAIENALLDVAGKILGVPVYAMLGGPLRERIPVYWSHCGTYRARHAALMGTQAVRTFDDLAALGDEVSAKGFSALKTNVLPLGADGFTTFSPGFGRSPGWPELNWTPALLATIAAELAAFRAGAGPDMGLMLDVNFHFKTEGFRRVADTVAPFGLQWLEVDTHDPASLALIRRDAPCPIASCETLTHRRDFKPYFEAYAMDVAIVDVVWNGLAESLKIAAMADVYEINVAPHNFYGHLCSAISAHFSAVVPNFRIMEIDIDNVSWIDEFYSSSPVIEAGAMALPAGPGWGVDVNEAAVRKRPGK